MFMLISKKKSRLAFALTLCICGVCACTYAAVQMVELSASSVEATNAEYSYEQASMPAMQAGISMAWGLSFKSEIAEPVPNFTSQELEPHNAYYLDDNAQNTLYLTFDSGYENGNMPQILDALKKNNVKATFFVVSSYINENTELVKRMINEGHTVGNHTYSHPNMTTLSEEEFKSQLLGLEEEFYALTNTNMGKFYRPPEGKFTQENLQWASELGYTTIFWSLAYVDWEVDNQPSKEYALEKLLPRTHSGAIVLLHSTSKTNAEILDELIQSWKQEGYTFSSLDKIGGTN